MKKVCAPVGSTHPGICSSPCTHKNVSKTFLKTVITVLASIFVSSLTLKGFSSFKLFSLTADVVFFQIEIACSLFPFLPGYYNITI